MLAFVAKRYQNGWGWGVSQTVYIPKDEHSTTPPKQALVLLNMVLRDAIWEKKPYKGDPAHRCLLPGLLCVFMSTAPAPPLTQAFHQGST